MTDNKEHTAQIADTVSKKKKRAGTVLFVFAVIFTCAALIGSIFSVSLAVPLFSAPKTSSSAGEAIGILAGTIIVAAVTIITDAVSLLISAAATLFSALSTAKNRGALRIISIVLLAASVLCLISLASILIVL